MSLSGFNAVSLKVRSDSSTCHTLYVKEHSVRENTDDRPSGRTLFVLNVPPFVDETHLKAIYSAVGRVESLHLGDKPTSVEKKSSSEFFRDETNTGFKACHVVFAEESELKKALRTKRLRLDEELLESSCGALKWIRDYNASVPNVKRMRAEINRYIEEYDGDVKTRVESEKAAGEADDEGWITVTKQGRKPGFERKESVTNKILATKNAKQQKKELKNFYTFQIRESKMNHIVTLRKKFEEDKKKIALLKQTRRFKPF